MSCLMLLPLHREGAYAPRRALLRAKSFVEELEVREHRRIGARSVSRHDDALGAAIRVAHREHDRFVVGIARAFETEDAVDERVADGVGVVTYVAGHRPVGTNADRNRVAVA